MELSRGDVVPLSEISGATERERCVYTYWFWLDLLTLGRHVINDFAF